jgi:Family of unknown function (DUF5309)
MAEFIDPAAFDLPDVEKAVDSTERSLLRQSLESIITKVDMKGTPLRKRWNRIRANGLTHEYTQRTSLGSPTSSFYPDGQLPPDGTTRYVRKGKQIKCIGESGRVTGLMIAAGRSFADQLAIEQQARMVSVLQQEETALLFGDTTQPTAVINPDGTQTIQYLQFDGVNRIITNEGGIIQDASAFSGGQKVSLPLVNTVIQAVYDALGEPTVIVAGSREKRFFNELLQSFVRVGGDQVVHVERQIGVSVMYYDSDFGSLPIIPTRYIQPSGGLTQMFIMCERTDAEQIIEVAVLQEIGSQPLAKIDDSERFMITEYQTLVCRAPQWQAVINNLSA